MKKGNVGINLIATPQTLAAVYIYIDRFQKNIKSGISKRNKIVLPKFKRENFGFVQQPDTGIS